MTTNQTDPTKRNETDGSKKDTVSKETFDPYAYASQYMARRQESPAKKIVLKTLFIAILSLLLLIPLQLVKNLIEEREEISTQARREISTEWGKSKRLSVAIAVPYKVNAGKTHDSGVIYISPDKCEIKAGLSHKILNIGRYDLPVYEAEVSFSGHFDSGKEFVNVSDTEYYDGHRIKDIKPDYGKAEIVVIDRDRGKVIRRKALGVEKKGDIAAFSDTFPIKGSESLSFITAGNYTVEMTGDTPDPNFRMGRIPDNRNVTDKGFEAIWSGSRDGNIINLHERKYYEDITGVEIVSAVSQYRMTMRTVKYAMLIVVLTFVTFLLVEIWRKKSVNPLQYILIGLALVLFYTLLLSFSEYMSFHYAYLIAAVMTTVLSTTYTASVFSDKRTAAILMSMLVLLYTYIYVLTQIESYSLLAGSIGLFVILAVVMFSSQKVINKR